MSTIYTDGSYAENNLGWHSEDSPWKAHQIIKVCRKNKLSANSIVEVGCGVGQILKEILASNEFPTAEFEGYDISPYAINIASRIVENRLHFYCEDYFATKRTKVPDLLLAIDVFEHVPDYWGFLQSCQAAAKLKIYHIPLDIHVNSVLRDQLASKRKTVGHIHVFSDSSALETLRDTGHEIVDYFYTCGALDLRHLHPTLNQSISNVPRWLISKLSIPLAARILGGYSLLVLAK